MYPPIVYNYYGRAKVYLYYKDSKLFSELKSEMNDLIKSFISDVINLFSLPVVITDSNKTQVIAFGNIDSSKVKDKLYIKKILREMNSQNEPIQIQSHELWEKLYLL